MYPEVFHVGFLHVRTYGPHARHRVPGGHVARLEGGATARHRRRPPRHRHPRGADRVGVRRASALRRRAHRGLPSPVDERVRAVAGRAHPLRRRGGGNVRRTVDGEALGPPGVDHGRRARAVDRARHDVRARGLLPERLLLRPADEPAVGRRLPAGFVPGLEFGQTPIHPAQLYFSIAGLALFALLLGAAHAAHRAGAPVLAVHRADGADAHRPRLHARVRAEQRRRAPGRGSTSARARS